MKFSIIMASYNQEAFVERAIESVLNQTYQNFELIIIDGKSTDNSFSIIEKYKENDKIKIIHEKDRGLYHARNKGILLASGDILSFLNTDDFYEKNALENIFNVFNTNKNIDIVYGITKVIDKNGGFRNNIGEPFNKELFLNKFKTIPDPSTFMKYHVLSVVGLYDISLKFAGDSDFWRRCMLFNLKFLFTNTVITNFNIYNETLTYNPKYKKARFLESKLVFKKYYKKIFSAYICNISFNFYIKKPLSNIRILKVIYNKLKNSK